MFANKPEIAERWGKEGKGYVSKKKRSSKKRRG
jgi:hypothetical protein